MDAARRRRQYSSGSNHVRTREIMKLKSCLTLLCLPAALAAQQSGYVTVSDGARLFYRTSGHPGPGIDTLIAIHGGPGLDLGTIYNDLALMFGDRHVVIYYDQRGGGRSEFRPTPPDSSPRVRSKTSTTCANISGCSASRLSRTRTARYSPEATPSRIQRT